MGVNNIYRYVNAAAVYTQGRADGVTTHTGTYTIDEETELGSTIDLGVTHTYRYVEVPEGGTDDIIARIRSDFFSGIKIIISTQSIKVGGRTGTISVGSGSTVYCIGSINNNCFSKSGDYASGGGFICFCESSGSFSCSGSYVQIYSTQTVTNANGKSVKVGGAWGNWGGNSAQVGGTTLSSYFWNGSNYASIGAAISNYYIF